MTRKEYMEDSSNRHHEYFLQFVTEGMKSSILDYYSKINLISLYENDKHFNNIPLQKIDQLALGYNFPSLSDGCCTIKAAMKEIVLEGMTALDWGKTTEERNKNIDEYEEEQAK